MWKWIVHRSGKVCVCPDSAEPLLILSRFYSSPDPRLGLANKVKFSSGRHSVSSVACETVSVSVPDTAT